MAGNYQRPKRSAHRQAKHLYDLNPPAAQSLATGYGLVKDATNEDFMALAFRLQFDGTYPSQLEVPEHETPVCSGKDFPEHIIMATRQGAIAVRTPCATNTDRSFNYSIESPYVTVTRPWQEQIPSPPASYPTYNDQIQTPLAVWERQAFAEEPFNNVREVATKPAQRQQEKHHDRNPQRGVKKTRLGS